MTDRDSILQRTHVGFDVFVHYMGDICRKKMFRNPFRTDRHPSCHLYYAGHDDGAGRFILKDFGDSSWDGDSFSFVSRVTGMDVKCCFRDILRTIDRELCLYMFDNVPAGCHPIVNNIVAEPIPECRRLKFTPKYRNFNKLEMSYWLSYGIPLDILRLFDVRCLSSCRFERADGTCYTIYGTKELPMFCYSYSGGTGIKVYRPGAEVGRFMYAGILPIPYVFGLSQLCRSDRTAFALSSSAFVKDLCLFVTGGVKDVLSLASRGFPAICLNSETSGVPISLFCQLPERFPYIVFLYDSDETGVRESALRVQECISFLRERHSSESKVLSVRLPLSGTRNEKGVSDSFRVGHGADDFSELVFSSVMKQS